MCICAFPFIEEWFVQFSVKINFQGKCSIKSTWFILVYDVSLTLYRMKYFGNIHPLIWRQNLNVRSGSETGGLLIQIPTATGKM